MERKKKPKTLGMVRNKHPEKPKSTGMVRGKKSKPQPKGMTRNKAPLVPQGTKFLWCIKDNQCQHYLVCRNKCKAHKKCRNYIIFMDNVRKEAGIGCL